MNKKYKQLKMINFEIFKNKKIFIKKIKINSIAMRFSISIKKAILIDLNYEKKNALRQFFYK